MLQIEEKLAGSTNYMEEKNWWERFSQIIFPSFPFFWQEASSDSLVEESDPAGLDDWNNMTTPARVRASIKVAMIVLFRMWVGFCPFDDAFRPNVTAKIKSPGSGASIC
jgi:hypothetical protein